MRATEAHGTSRTNRFLLTIGAVGCLVIAMLLVITAGLPDRAAFSGEIMPDGDIFAPEIGAYAPLWSAPTLDGRVDTTDLRGTPLVINFWATWCVPCRIEMPELQAIHEAYPEVSVLAVNLGEPRELIVDWIRYFGLTFDVALDNGDIATLYRLRGQPSTYIVAPDGMITSIFYGATNRQSLEAALEPFLRG